MKKTISILTALAVLAGAAVNAIAISEETYSTDTAVITGAITQMSDSEREDFINENLDVKLQHMSTLATLTANRNYEQIDDEVAKAIEDGLTAVEIKEAIYQSAPYCGYTRAIKALDAADKALTDLGVALPSESRITSTEETRYEDGLATQRYLFGQQIGTITDDMSASQKLQTVYLSGICFGDFYNRTGLSLYTREFLTFCTIAGNGNCTGQLRSHTNGNLNVGHSKNMLRAAILLNEEYNGTDKTVTALGIINALDNEAATEFAPEPTAAKTISSEYTTDSQELSDIMEHYRTDDKDGYINANLDESMQKLITDAVSAYIDGTAAVTSEDAAAQALIDLALLGAEGGREADVAKTVAENLSAGNTADMMLAMPLLCVPYNGFPRTLNMMNAVNAALADIQEAEETIITMQIGSPNMTVNNEIQEIDPGMGTTPVIQNDRTLLPVRAVIEALGGTVEWNGDTRTALLSYGDDVISLTIDNTTAYLNNAAQTLDVAPVIINDRTMLPIRFIAESFGFDVDWTQETQTVTITKSAAAESTPIPTATPVPTVTPTSSPVETTAPTDAPIVYGEDYDPDAEYGDFKPYDEEMTAEEAEALDEEE